jgi:hypothetical protein
MEFAAISYCCCVPLGQFDYRHTLLGVTMDMAKVGWLVDWLIGNGSF